MSNETEIKPKPILYAWEIVMIIPNPKDEEKQLRTRMIIAAQTIDQVWDYLAPDRADEKTDVERINNIGAIVSVINP